METANAGASAQVKIYTTPVCPYCQMAKEFMKDQGVSYEEIDVTKSQPALQEMIQKSGQMGVPVLDINGKITVGFNRKVLADLLGVKLES